MGLSLAIPQVEDSSVRNTRSQPSLLGDQLVEARTHEQVAHIRPIASGFVPFQQREESMVGVQEYSIARKHSYNNGSEGAK